MRYLWFVTALWAFSFSLIGVYLSGHVDSYFAILVQKALACAVFAPFLLVRELRTTTIIQLMGVGAVQIGLMSIFYYQAFGWLTVPELLLFTIFTPVYITLIDDLLARRFSPGYLVTAIGAIAGAAVIRYHHLSSGYWVGFFLIQGANVCFAVGQVWYRRVAADLPTGLRTTRVFGWFFLGALPVAIAAFALLGNADKLPTTSVQWSVIAWLGIGASALGYFFWNQGATRVDAGALAIMNNALIPAGLIVNVVIWNRDADLVRLATGALIILAALAINTRLSRQATRRHQRYSPVE